MMPEMPDPAADTLPDALPTHLPDGPQREAVLAVMSAPSANADRRIVLIPDGPYLLLGDAVVVDHLGCRLPGIAARALCRCGESAVKPDCDGACLRTGFVASKDPARTPDRRDEYVGQQITVLDNRGLCQHSGLCTDRVSRVFHAGSEPFVTPSGDRMDEIIRAVRDCPSGALGMAVDGVEIRTLIDHGGSRAATVEVTRDGPYRVTGALPLNDVDGRALERNQGASLEHYALCRCGHSQNKPFCSGMHYYVGFTDPPANPDLTPSIFEWAGGLPALTRMTRIFYSKYVPADPLLGPLFARMSADHPERVAAWLGEVFGGPQIYSTTYGGYPRMIAEHLGKCLTEQQRARWVTLLTQSAVDAGLPNDAEFRAAFGSYIEWGTRLAVENSQNESIPPMSMPMPHWDWRTAAGPPGSRRSALIPAEQDDAPIVEVPGPDSSVTFADHVRPLFRRRDRESMMFVFDLWDPDHVRTHADTILSRLEAGTMPCDGPWPADQITILSRWINDGFLP